LVVGDEFRNVRSLIHELRNTIHSAGLTHTHSVSRSGEPTKSLVQVPQNEVTKICDAAKKCGGLNRWGLEERTVEVNGQLETYTLLEPYTYSTTLVDDSFTLIDAIAAATDVTRLFDGSSVPVLENKPPKDNQVFNELNLKRVGVLG
jgi:hypothetical protein